MSEYETGSFQENSQLISDIIIDTLKKNYQDEYNLFEKLCPGYIERYFYIKLANSEDFLRLIAILYKKVNYKKKLIFKSNIEYDCANTLKRRRVLKIKIIKKINLKEKIKNNKMFIIFYFLIMHFFHKFIRKYKNINQFEYVFYCTNNHEVKYFDKIKKIFPNYIFCNNFDLFYFYLAKINTGLFLKQVFFCIKNFKQLNYHLIIGKLFDNNISKQLNIFFFEGDNPQQYLFKRHKRVCFQHGNFFSNNVPIFLRDMNFDYFLTWGNFFKKKFELFNKYKCKFLAFGKIKHTNCLINNASKKGKYIIFASQTICPEISKENYINYFKILEKISMNNPDYTFILRPHPKYPIENNILKKYCYSKNIVKENSNNIDIKNNLIKSKIIVFITSTSFMDALLYDVIPISYWNSDAKLNPDLNKYKIGYQSKNKNDVMTIIQKLIDNEKYYNLFKANIKKIKKNYVKIPNTVDFSNLKKIFN